MQLELKMFLVMSSQLSTATLIQMLYIYIYVACTQKYIYFYIAYIWNDISENSDTTFYYICIFHFAKIFIFTYGNTFIITLC